MRWQVNQAESVSVGDGERSASILPSGDGWVRPEQTTTYTLIARGAGIQVIATAVLAVVAPPPAPTIEPTPTLPPIPASALPPTPPAVALSPAVLQPAPIQPAQIVVNIAPPATPPGSRGLQMQLLLLLLMAGILAAVPMGILCLVAILVIIRRIAA